MTANEQFFDAMVRHQIGLLRFSGSVQKRILAILDETEADIIAKILRSRLNGSQKRLRVLQKSIASIRQQAWTKSAAVWREELLSLAKSEPEFIASALRTVAPVQLELLLPTADVLRSIVTTRPFEGKVLSDWAKGIARGDIDRINASIAIGMTQGETSAQIARRVTGTVDQRGRNGVTQIARNNATMLTRTAVNAIANQAKRELYKANSGLFDEEVYVATLDGRTTPVCRSLDGDTFPVGEGPVPPLHFGCRSLRVAAFDGGALGQRPTKTATRKQLLREFSTKHGIRTPASRENLPRGKKGLFDEFARIRIRELTGRIDARVSYGDWLRRQSAEFQDDVLGVTRARLFRRGKLQLDKFVDRTGSERTLAELARREADAFRAAGLNPDDFI